MATIQVRIDDKTKAEADHLFISLGLDVSTAIRMFIAASLETQGIPFEIKKKHTRIEINDGHGSYVCEDGIFHDYSKLQAVIEKNRNDTIGPFDSVEDLMRSLDE